MCTCHTGDKYIVSQFKYKDEIYHLLECEICGYIQTKPVDKVVIDIYETGHYQVKPYFYIPLLINFLDYVYILSLIHI